MANENKKCGCISGAGVWFPRHVYERLRDLDNARFKKITCALLDRAFYFNVTKELDGTERALYEAHMAYFPRLAPAAPPKEILPPEIVIDGNTCELFTEQVAHVFYWVMPAKKLVEEDEELELDGCCCGCRDCSCHEEGEVVIPRLDEWTFYKGPFDVKHGETVLAVCARGGYTSEAATKFLPYPPEEEDVPAGDENDSSSSEDVSSGEDNSSEIEDAGNSHEDDVSHETENDEAGSSQDEGAVNKVEDASNDSEDASTENEDDVT